MTMYIDARPATLTRPVIRFSLSHVLSRILSVWNQRQHLKTLDDSALEDLGLSYRQAAAEARRPIWDVPTFWQK